MFSRISVLWNRHATDFKFQAATLRMRDAQQMVHGGETFHAFAMAPKNASIFETKLLVCT
jgi:hypothetical protein